MKWYSFHSFIFPVILTGFIIFFTCCSGCINDSSPTGPAAPPTNPLPQIPRTDTRCDTGSDPASLPLPPGNLPRMVPQGTGSLVIWSSPPACSVYIDGMYAGDTPTGPDSFTTPVKSGPHIVKITKIGYEDYTQNVVISGGGSDTITATLSEKPFPYYTLHPTSPVTGSVY